MIKYEVIISDKAKEHIELFRKSGQEIITKKIDKLLNELKEHPKTGTGHPEFLKYEKCWSRRIDKEHRLCYEVYDDKIVVLVLTAYGHYEDN